MSVFNISRIQLGEVGVKPGSLKMVSSDNLVTITSAGYLNNMGTQLLPSLAIAPSDVIECLYSYNVITDSGSLVYLQPSISGGVITLNSLNIPAVLTLANNEIFVGNASNVATAVAMSGDATIVASGALTIANGAINNAKVASNAAIAFSKLATLATGHILAGNAGVVTDVTLSGDATIGATGVVTIANDAITTVKILNANVTLAKLAAGITPSHIIKFANQVTTVGGAPAEVITVTGALAASDRAFVQMVDNGTNNVTVLEAVVTNDTLTVTFSADPGNDAIINYQLIRAAS